MTGLHATSVPRRPALTLDTQMYGKNVPNTIKTRFYLERSSVAAETAGHSVTYSAYADFTYVT